MLPPVAKATGGRADAQLFLGSSYCDGDGLPQDFGLAVKWLLNAAPQGKALAQMNVGSMYAKGEAGRHVQSPLLQ
jgi:TPR repeat protein